MVTCTAVLCCAHACRLSRCHIGMYLRALLEALGHGALVRVDRPLEGTRAVCAKSEVGRPNRSAGLAAHQRGQRTQTDGVETSAGQLDRRGGMMRPRLSVSVSMCVTRFSQGIEVHAWYVRPLPRSVGEQQAVVGHRHTRLQPTQIHRHPSLHG